MQCISENSVTGYKEEEQEPEERIIVVRFGVSAVRVHGALQGVPGERAGGRQQAQEGRAHRTARRNRGHLVGQVRYLGMVTQPVLYQLGVTISHIVQI